MSMFTNLNKVFNPDNFVAPKRIVHTIFLHCTASSNPQYSVWRIHEDHIKNNYGGFGYHYLIEFDGTIREGRGLEFIPAAQKGYNTGTIAICLQGLNLLDFTPDQFRAMKRLIHRIVTATPHGGLSSRVRIRGHREVANKTCPVFNYRGILDLNAEGFLSRKGVDALAASWYDGPAVEKKDEDPVEFTTVTAGAWRERVRAFQRANNLEVDGNVGPATWSVIETYLKQLEI